MEKQPRNIPTINCDPDQAPKSDGPLDLYLKAIFKEVVEKANSSIEWYHRNASRKRNIGKLLRGGIVLMVAIGTLLPLFIDIVAIYQNESITKLLIPASLASFTMAIAGVFIGWDRFFGVSSGWVRYVLTAMRLIQRLDRFCFEWNLLELKFNKSGAKDQGIAEDMIKLAQKFIEDLNQIISEETNAWALEFQNAIALMEKFIAQQKGNPPNGNGTPPGGGQSGAGDNTGKPQGNP